MFGFISRVCVSPLEPEQSLEVVLKIIQFTRTSPDLLWVEALMSFIVCFIPVDSSGTVFFIPAVSSATSFNWQQSSIEYRSEMTSSFMWFHTNWTDTFYRPVPTVVSIICHKKDSDIQWWVSQLQFIQYFIHQEFD